MLNNLQPHKPLEMNDLTKQDVESYIKELGHEPRHNTWAIAEACNELDYLWDELPSADALMRFVLGDEPIKGMYTHSYGFHTADGRAIVEQFTNYYNQYNE